ncbi:hypothetical protein [Mucilaginibacter ginsenosidivorans]|uniref:Uncharacterized protein n=1 Tax=Mucilaginibacter ginsenosidivorans TaxID=398053 RepID=A0A5B8UWH5_9SPHI|nr:hypothetical protein [Mucilaginibacter ginsenosidivorans]QEC63035.1 hypothetical protein FRZ54_10735 [Mucilaginibacter ginsenosidivorans]
MTAVQGKDYMCFTSVDAPNLADIRPIDSLIKLAPERSALEVFEGGDYAFRTTYKVFYFENNKLKYRGNDAPHLPAGQMDRVGSLLKNADTTGSGQHIIYQYTGKNKNSARFDFYYLFIINGKVAKSLLSNVPLNEITDDDIKGKMKLFVSIF